MLLDIICKGGSFHAWVYNGTPENYLWRRRIKDCLLVADAPDADRESGTQALTISGTIHYHYFGEEEAGNVPHLRGGEGQGGKC